MDHKLDCKASYHLHAMNQNKLREDLTWFGCALRNLFFSLWKVLLKLTSRVLILAWRHGGLCHATDITTSLDLIGAPPTCSLPCNTTFAIIKHRYSGRICLSDIKTRDWMHINLTIIGTLHTGKNAYIILYTTQNAGMDKIVLISPAIVYWNIWACNHPLTTMLSGLTLERNRLKLVHWDICLWNMGIFTCLVWFL